MVRTDALFIILNNYYFRQETQKYGLSIMNYMSTIFYYCYNNIINIVEYMNLKNSTITFFYCLIWKL